MAGHELPPKPAGLVIGQVRARGSYGTVHSGELDGSPVVVKKLHHVLLQAPDNDQLMINFYRECRILSTIRHANVVRFIGAYWDQEAKEPLLVMEAAIANLREFLERNKAHLGLEKQLAISSSMTEGLRFLHEREKPIIHRDLKPENVLVCEDGTVKIGDLGQSKLLDQPQSYMKTTQPGTLGYMPPEVLKKKPSYTSKVDVFSLGAVMLEVCTQSPPSLSLEGIGTVPEVERREDDLALLEDTHPLKPLIIWCLQDSHKSRPDVKSTHAQVKLLEGGVKEAYYQQRIRQLEVALRESRGREMGLQRRLHRTVSELEYTNAQVADLQIVVEKGRQEVRETKLQYELLTRDWSQSDDTPGVTPGAPPTQQPPLPQSQARMKNFQCKLTFDVVRVMSLYDRGRIVTVNSTKGMLVASVEVNKDTLACGVQPLDLITQLDDKRAEDLGDSFGQCDLLGKMTKTVADAWIARMSLIPSMSDLQGLVESHQSIRKCKIVGFLVTQKDLMDPASFLGVHMDGRSNGKMVDRVEVLSEANKAGLCKNDIIESVTLVTKHGVVHGPDVEWSFNSISRTAKTSPSVFALLMIVLNF